jgi:hypothetical protein
LRVKAIRRSSASSRRGGLIRVRGSVRDWGAPDTAGRLLVAAVTRLLHPAFRRRDVPPLVKFAEFAAFAADVPRRLAVIDAATLARLRGEHAGSRGRSRTATRAARCRTNARGR